MLRLKFLAGITVLSVAGLLMEDSHRMVAESLVNSWLILSNPTLIASDMPWSLMQI
jgi:hypothetical protein